MDTKSGLLAQGGGIEYEEIISLLDEDDFFSLFSRLNASPCWVNSAGKRAIKIIGLCHNGSKHSALFDPTTAKVNCFADCGGMMLHTWVYKALQMDYPQQAKDFITAWIDNTDIDLSDRVLNSIDFEYKERQYAPTRIEPVQGIPQEILQDIYSDCDTSQETLARLLWHTQDEIPVEILSDFNIAYHNINKTIILPHHNIHGEIVGLYERSYSPLRKDIQQQYEDMPRKMLYTFPRAKYVPLLRKEVHRTTAKSSWSFENSKNLYGLHKAKEAIQETGTAIVFEGAKSVMLARHYGYYNTVATHTFGISENHISMLIECGAREIILGFDKQYETQTGQAWDLYEHKTNSIAEKVKNYVVVYRLIDNSGLLQYKDAPTDRGKAAFIKLLEAKENLTADKKCTVSDNRKMPASASDKQERTEKAEKEYSEFISKLEQELNTLAAQKQFLFDNLLIQRMEKDINFLLPNENNIQVTPYEIIERLAGKDFKSYAKQIHFKNNKIQLLPNSERYKLIFYFRQQYKSPLPIANADTIAAFINTALKYTDNIKLYQNWYACLEATATQEAAASLFACYGWAHNYNEKYPKLENTFYTVTTTGGERHYNIVNDDILLRFTAIENEGRGGAACDIITDTKLRYKEKYTKLDNLLYPLLWRRKDVKMGLTKEALNDCKSRIDDYIHSLLHCGGIDEIYNVKIDTSGIDLTFAPPQAFTISLNDMDFTDRTYNITAQYNKDNAAALGAARSMNAATKNLEHVTGNAWSTAELNAQGISKNKITRLVDNGLIERTKRGYYRRISS